ncbi:MAG TPA: carboxypeptidase-like regulatory domain-containing protein [Gemmatimonadales bacterium]
MRLSQPIGRTILLAAALAIFAATTRAAAQSLTAGSLTATIVDQGHAPLRDVTVTLERNGSAYRTVATNRLGVVAFAGLTPGSYSVLAEELGYQPVRMRGVSVVSNGRSSLTITLVRRPPPITTVDEIPSSATVATTTAERAISGDALRLFARRHDITGTASAFSEADVPLDGRDGLVLSGDGLRPAYSSLVVDGMREALLRHPGMPSEPASAPLFARDGVTQTLFTGFAGSGEWPTSLGALMAADTRSGNGKVTVQPWATFSSAKLGGRGADNPGDSSATSFQAGIALGGSIKRDTASWFIRGDYQQIELPTANPFAVGSAVTDSVAAVPKTVTLPTNSPALDLGRWLSPTVRSWKGGSASGRLDWRFGSNTALALRAGGASWTEDNPDVGLELASAAGAHLSAHDVSAAGSLTTGSDNLTSETRLGFHTSKRDWTGAAVPYTGIVAEGVAVGGAATLPGTFEETGIELSETATYRSGINTVKGGGALQHRTVNYDWLPGGAGRFYFGDVATFGAGQGAFYQAINSAPAPDLGVTDISLFVEDELQATPALLISAGFRLDHETLPSDAVNGNAEWGRVSGFPNNVVPADKTSRDIGPRGSFSWDVSGSGRTLVRGDAGILSGQYDLTALAEAAEFDGTVSVRRATGTLDWPSVGASAGNDAGEALTTFGPDVRKPRSFKADLALVQHLAGAATLTFTGGYRHGDYLLQREDLNRVAGVVATGSDGRPIYGALQQFGGLVTPDVGSNRRFPEFDMVYGLTSTGYNDYYEATATLDDRLAAHFNALVSYTYSRTTDNLPGELSADPADRLSPFPDGLNGARWEDGRSDFDVPHRIAATLRYTSAGASPITVAARYRYRSGFPFTPGFQPGVDANGDGSGNNDPAFVATSIDGMQALTAANACLGSQAGAFAERNSCRDPGVHAVDLQASIAIRHGWAITIDGFNLIGSTTGLYDHAAVLVDPSRSITTDGSGQTVLPLIANPDFGKLLSRRGEPRVLRIGIRVEN